MADNDPAIAGITAGVEVMIEDDPVIGGMPVVVDDDSTVDTKGGPVVGIMESSNKKQKYYNYYAHITKKIIKQCTVYYHYNWSYHHKLMTSPETY